MDISKINVTITLTDNKINESKTVIDKYNNYNNKHNIMTNNVIFWIISIFLHIIMFCKFLKL